MTTRRVRLVTLSRFDVKALRFAVLSKYWALDHVAALSGEKAVLANEWLHRTYGLTLADLQARSEEVAHAAR